MSDIESWLDSIEAPKCDDRGWVYTNIGRIEAYLEEDKQALKQRLIDEILKDDAPSLLHRDYVLDVVKKVFSEP